MDVLYPNCAGLDVHKDMVEANHWRVVDGKVEREVRTVGTITKGLPDLSAWLAAARDARTSSWRRRGSIGRRFGTFSAMAIWRWCWRMRPM